MEEGAQNECIEDDLQQGDDHGEEHLLRMGDNQFAVAERGHPCPAHVERDQIGLGVGHGLWVEMHVGAKELKLRGPAGELERRAVHAPRAHTPPHARAPVRHGEEHKSELEDGEEGHVRCQVAVHVLQVAHEVHEPRAPEDLAKIPQGLPTGHEQEENAARVQDEDGQDFKGEPAPGDERAGGLGARVTHGDARQLHVRLGLSHGLLHRDDDGDDLHHVHDDVQGNDHGVWDERPRKGLAQRYGELLIGERRQADGPVRVHPPSTSRLLLLQLALLRVRVCLHVRRLLHKALDESHSGRPAGGSYARGAQDAARPARDRPAAAAKSCPEA
mmetsp:Transcript_17701/g.51456  ORF Transcript_17701/g.51456 Transcript_17701/m.51456 type:complete len:330 (+) Transcript_17701:6336-7325(+)